MPHPESCPKPGWLGPYWMGGKPTAEVGTGWLLRFIPAGGCAPHNLLLTGPLPSGMGRELEKNPTKVELMS